MSKMTMAGPCDRTGPLFGPNPLKLGLFGVNINSGGALTTAPDRHEIGWDQNLRLVRQAEAAGFEAAVPFARWRGLEGASNPWGDSFETYAWAAGMAAATERITVAATSHILTLSPILAAKQLTTIDHVSHGRVMLNVVAGWFEKELDMFGVANLGHDERYEYGDEWIEALYRLWGDEAEFDLQGRHIRIRNGYQQPKNVQSPRPPVMNAGFSPRGQAFAARWADIAFIAPDPGKPEAVADTVAARKRQAAELGRSLQVWVAVSMVAADTDEAAASEVASRQSHADQEAIGNCMSWTMGGIDLPDEHRQAIARQMGSFAAGFPVVGSHRTVAEKMAAMSEAGVDGLCVVWLNYERGLPDFIANVLPHLERLGVRDAYRPDRSA